MSPGKSWPARMAELSSRFLGGERRGQQSMENHGTWSAGAAGGRGAHGRRRRAEDAADDGWGGHSKQGKRRPPEHAGARMAAHAELGHGALVVRPVAVVPELHLRDHALCLQHGALRRKPRHRARAFPPPHLEGARHTILGQDWLQSVGASSTGSRMVGAEAGSGMAHHVPANHTPPRVPQGSGLVNELSAANHTPRKRLTIHSPARPIIHPC